jgi:hypothetical protein
VLLQTLQPSAEQDAARRLVVGEMQQLVAEALPASLHCSVETFGSFRAGLHLPGEQQQHCGSSSSSSGCVVLVHCSVETFRSFRAGLHLCQVSAPVPGQCTCARSVHLCQVSAPVPGQCTCARSGPTAIDIEI